MNSNFDNDIVFAQFLTYMKKAIHHKRLNYLRKQRSIEDIEKSIDEYKENKAKDTNISIFKLGILNEKEIYTLELHYIQGLSYEEISKITNEKICTIKQRRSRAIEKLKKIMEE